MPPGSPFRTFSTSSDAKRLETEHERQSSVNTLSIALLNPVAHFTPMPAVESELTS
jgi:hypothetical protein